LTKIEQLENKLNENLKIQYLLREKLKSNIKTLDEVESKLKVIEAHSKHLSEYIYTLQQENCVLKSSCDGWMKRAIKLEFEVLSARNATKK